MLTADDEAPVTKPAGGTAAPEAAAAPPADFLEAMVGG